MNFTLQAFLITLGLLLGILLFLEIGRRIGVYRLNRDEEGLAKGGGAAEGAIFALLGLLIAFTFSGAASRFEERRHLITEETNNIGTAYLRIDLLPNDAQTEMRELFKHYLDSRIAIFNSAENKPILFEKIKESEQLQQKIWSTAIRDVKRTDAIPSAAMLFLPALNAMIDITTTRLTATRNHPPIIIFGLLISLSFISALLVGYSVSENEDRDWLHPLVFASIMTLTIYVIIDLEYPRLGLIRISDADQVLIDLRNSMK